MQAAKGMKKSIALPSCDISEPQQREHDLKEQGWLRRPGSNQWTFIVLKAHSAGGKSCLVLVDPKHHSKH